jgi:hypothetical protein
MLRMLSFDVAYSAFRCCKSKSDESDNYINMI